MLFKKNKTNKTSKPATKIEKEAAAYSKEKIAKKQPVTKKKIINYVIMLILVAFVLLAGTITFKEIKKYQAENKAPDKYEQTDIETVKLPKEISDFVYQNLYEIYAILFDYNKEIKVIDKEIDRINKIGEKYPNYSNLTGIAMQSFLSKKKIMQQKADELSKILKKFYVTWLVNKEKGQRLIDSQKESIINENQIILQEVREITNPLKEEKKENIINKIKKQIF